MTFLLIVIAIRLVFVLVNRMGKDGEEFDLGGYEDGPSEHNVWW